MRLTAPNRRRLRAFVVTAKAGVSKTPWEADAAQPIKCRLRGCNRRFIPKGSQKACEPAHAEAIARQRRYKRWPAYYAANRDRFNTRAREKINAWQRARYHAKKAAEIHAEA